MVGRFSEGETLTGFPSPTSAISLSVYLQSCCGTRDFEGIVRHVFVG